LYAIAAHGTESARGAEAWYLRTDIGRRLESEMRKDVLKPYWPIEEMVGNEMKRQLHIESCSRYLRLRASSVSSCRPQAPSHLTLGTNTEIP